MSLIENLNNQLPLAQEAKQELQKYNVNSFLDFAVETLSEGSKSLQAIENNEQRIRNYKKNQKCYDILCCSIPKLISAIPILACICCVDVASQCCGDDGLPCKNYFKPIVQPWWRTCEIDSLESENSLLDNDVLFNAKECIKPHPATPSNSEMRLTQVIKMKDSKYQPLIFDYLARIPKSQQVVFSYDDGWYLPKRENLEKIPKRDRFLESESICDIERRLYREKYNPMRKVLLNESFLKSFELTIQLRSSCRDILIQEKLPAAILDDILLGYIGIPTAKEFANEKASEEESMKVQEYHNDEKALVTFHVDHSKLDV